MDRFGQWIGLSEGLGYQLKALLLCSPLPDNFKIADRPRSAESRRRTGKCVIAYINQREKEHDAYLCACGVREIKFTHFIGPIKHAHILRGGTLRMQVADPEEICSSRRR